MNLRPNKKEGSEVGAPRQWQCDRWLPSTNAELRHAGCQDGLGLSHCHSFGIFISPRPLKLGKNTVKSARYRFADLHRIARETPPWYLTPSQGIRVPPRNLRLTSYFHWKWNHAPIHCPTQHDNTIATPAIGSNSSITERWGWVVWAQRPKNIEVCYSSWIQKSLSSNKREKMLGTTQQAKPRQISPKEVR